MKAVTYARISTDKQSETSITEQTRRARQYAEMKGWDVIDSFEDIGTGMNMEREGFKELMDRTEEWDVVVAYKLDRFHRSSTNAQTWASNLNSIGKNFVAMDIDVDTTSAMGMAVFRIITALNQMEVEVTRERTKMGLQGVKNDGRHVGKPPYGYDSVYAISEDPKDKGILIPNEEEADIVKIIFAAHDKDLKSAAIAEALIRAKIETRSGKLRWTTVVIKDILKRESFYRGLYYDADNELKRYSWEAILDDKEDN